MKTSRWVVLFLGLTVCSGKEVAITILHTTDLHATVLPTMDYEGTKDVGGLARCAWMIRRIRAQEKNVLLVDAGDLYQGAALGYLTEGAAMIRAINALRYDSWTLGNHEFDWGIEKIAARIAEARVPVLAANIHHKPVANTPAAITDAFRKIQPYVIREVEGVKVGIVGLDTPGIPSWSRPRLIPGISVEESVAALRRVIPRMKADGCAILVLTTHQGIREQGDDHANQLYAISRAFPEMDVIIGGHTHRTHVQQQINGILYTQANYWGTYLGRVDLAYDTDKRKLISRKAELVPMDASVGMDEEFLRLLKSDLEKTEAFLGTKLGEIQDRFHSLKAPKSETPIFNLLCAAIAEALEARGAKTDAVLHGIFNERMVLEPGPITMRDIFAIVPYENTIGVATLTRDQLVEILEENASAYQTGRFRGLWGLTMKLRISAPDGRRVVFVGDREGRSLASDARLRVAFNSYDLASGGMRWNRLRKIVDRPVAGLKEFDFQTRDAVIEYVRKHSPLRAENRGWWSLDRTKSFVPKPGP
ncbi:MAG: bifunctional metallophosphatase/5'-nucleotidase [Verrucomicrobia bacterium]|nr:bifunctional metallophosphatase/5'-nucleotidase [Verrucomicrobiota bacterium]